MIIKREKFLVERWRRGVDQDRAEMMLCRDV